MSKYLSVISRITNKTVELSPKERRTIRKTEARAFSGVFQNFRLHLPYYASGINALFFYRPPVKDKDLLRPFDPVQDAYSEVGEVLHTTAPVAAIAAPAPKAKAGSKVNMELARTIRAYSNMSAAAIAKQFGLGETTVRDILKNKTWKEPVTA